jgi:hypothetical protein
MSRLWRRAARLSSREAPSGRRPCVARSVLTRHITECDASWSVVRSAVVAARAHPSPAALALAVLSAKPAANATAPAIAYARNISCPSPWWTRRV